MNSSDMLPISDEQSVDSTWNLTLFVAGQAPKSLLAFANLRKVCEQHLSGQFKIQVVDLSKEPAMAKENRIVAIPTLIRRSPAPEKRIIGSLSDLGRLAEDLELNPNYQ